MNIFLQKKKVYPGIFKYLKNTYLCCWKENGSYILKSKTKQLELSLVAETTIKWMKL